VLITKCSDVDYIAKAYCRSLLKVQCVSVGASLNVVAHSYEGPDAASLLKGRSHNRWTLCRRQESERQFQKALFWNAPYLRSFRIGFIRTGNDWTFCNFTTLACSKRERQLEPSRQYAHARRTIEVLQDDAVTCSDPILGLWHAHSKIRSLFPGILSYTKRTITIRKEYWRSS
jgi:hypothetical protein